MQSTGKSSLYRSSSAQVCFYNTAKVIKF